MDIETALAIAEKAHLGQVDKAGAAYIEHPKAVAAMVEGDLCKMVALLHDTVEDSSVTLDYLREKGFNSDVVDAVATLTHSRKDTYEQYLSLVKKNDIARKVKLADLTHNMQLERIPNPTPKDYSRLEKYKAAYEFLIKD